MARPGQQLVRADEDRDAVSVAQPPFIRPVRAPDPLNAVTCYERCAPFYDELAQSHGWTSPDVMYRCLKSRLGHARRLLDVGIGTGLSALPFARRGLDVDGVDGSQHMLDQCRQRGVAQTLHRVDLAREALPYATGSHDVVISNGVLYQIEALDHVFAEMARCLAPDGVLCFNVEASDLADGAPPDEDGVALYEDVVAISGFHTYRHGVRHMARLMARHGLVPVHQEHYVAYRIPGGGKEKVFRLYVCHKAQDPDEAVAERRAERAAETK